MNRRLVILSIAALASCAPSHDRAPIERAPVSPPATAASALPSIDSAAVSFVQAFYQTYGPRGAASGLAAVDSLLKERPTLFTPTLLAALRRDAAARAAAKGDIVGLDWEPLLNSQDPCARYTVGAASRVASRIRVNVYAACDGTRSDSATVVAEVEPVGPSWAFANFIYGPPTGDLLQALRALHP